MDITPILNVLQVLSGLLIIALVLLQRQDTGFYSSSTNINRTRRGLEKVTYNLTIFTGVMFTLISIANFLV